MKDNEIDGTMLFQAFMGGYENLSGSREYINSINYFPVHDGDTGNNMVSTFRTIGEGLVSKESFYQVMDQIADLSLSGARGNSGLIISQFLNGVSRFTQERETIPFSEMGIILRQSADYAYRAMENPREGTILSVIKAWAEATEKVCHDEGSIWSILNQGLDEAKIALERTPDQLGVLKEHNVVDAGALGFVRFLEGISLLEKGGAISHPFRDNSEEEGAWGKELGQETDYEHSHTDFRYCTEVLLEVNEVTQSLRETLNEMGDSLVISQGRQKARIHIHTNSPESFVGFLRTQGQGRILQQKVDDMFRQEQINEEKLSTVGILTDSTADIPLELLDKYQIHVINLPLLWDDESYIDRITLHPETFYKMQEVRTSFPSSSLPSASQVDSNFSYLLERYEHLLVIPVANALSGTWQQMTLSAQKFNKEKERVVVVDSCLNSVAQGLLVYRVAKAAAHGGSFTELCAMAEELKTRIKIYVSVKTFKFMIRGGRVSPLKGLLARVLNIKPIVSLDREGRGIAFDKSFSAKGLMKKIASIIKETQTHPGIEEFAVVHALSEGRAKSFSHLVEKNVQTPPTYISDISPIVGMHSGKGAVAIGVIEKGASRG